MRGSDYTQGQHRRDESAPLDALDAEIARAFRNSDGLVNHPYTPRRVTGRYVAKPWEFILADAANGAFTVLLPDPSSRDVVGTQVIIKAASSRWDYDTFVTVKPTSGSIDGQASITIGRTTDSVLLLSNGLEWKIVAHYRPFRWRGGYKVDFTELAAQTIVNGTQTIDGRTWTGVNVGNCASFAIVAGTGLQIVASATVTDYNGATRTAPMLQLPFLTGIFSNYAVGNYIVRLQARVLLTNANANFEGARLGVEALTTPTNQNFQINKYYNGGIRHEVLSTVSGTTTATQETGYASDDIMQIICEAPRGFEAGTGVYDGSGYMNADHPWHSTSQNIATALLVSNTQPIAFMGQASTNNNANLTTTFTHFQGDFYERHPFTNP